MLRVALIYHWSFHRRIHLSIWKLFEQNHGEFARYSRALITVRPQYGGHVNSAPVRRTRTTNIYVFLMTYRSRTNDCQSINFIPPRKKQTAPAAYSRRIEPARFPGERSSYWVNGEEFLLSRRFGIIERKWPNGRYTVNYEIQFTRISVHASCEPVHYATKSCWLFWKWPRA